MVVILLVVTFMVSFSVAFITDRVFRRPIESILNRLIPEDINYAWSKYLQFAIYVVGLSSGVRIWELEKYITPLSPGEKTQVIVLTPERWALEVYRTVIQTLAGIAWMLLVFFIIALIAYVIIKIFESKREKRATDPNDT
ncbi:MAG: hypothetical protein HPY90_04930 [Syntrophothermus sp.]|uniref:hypothetical protein n=1 Tax=Syntrophothermus sp. TaxID=2736299 RepID=UPI00257A4248|nr:hypothetical protein [Syntrophothermus sp.]NSW82612.1 hypothetical protein [Syntrophothermus sp.]